MFKYSEDGYVVDRSPTFGKFNPNLSPTHLGQEWERWYRLFELYARGKGVSGATQKRSLLLQCAGLEVQDVFFTLKEEGEEDENAYQKCVRTIKKHFTSFYKFIHNTVGHYVHTYTKLHTSMAIRGIK